MTRAPIRIQRRRTKGWQMPEGALYVGRGSKFGNPYRIGPDATAEWVTAVYASAMWSPQMVNIREWIREELRGKDLACWCPLDQPFHADVLLRIANECPTTTPSAGA